MIAIMASYDDKMHTVSLNTSTVYRHVNVIVCWKYEHCMLATM